MREFVPANRPEALDEFRDQPVMGLFDEGLHTQNPLRLHIPNDYESGYVEYRQYRALAFPKTDTEDIAYGKVRDHLFPSEVQAMGIGNSYYSDLWSKYPAYLYPSGHRANVIPAIESQVNVANVRLLIGNKTTARDLSGEYMDAILREQPIQPLLLVGSVAIDGFVEGYLSQSESDVEKRMPSRDTGYLLPRIDWDVLTMVVTARMAGVPADRVKIPEEHRYRVLLNAANTLAHYYTGLKSEYDLRLAPESSFKSQRERDLLLEMSMPGHSVMHILHGTYADFYKAPYDPSMACLLYAYDIKPEELVEVTQQVWYASEYWSQIGSQIPLDELRDHYDQMPDPNHARLFLEGITSEQAAYYAELVKKSVMLAADPYKLMLDRR